MPRRPSRFIRATAGALAFAAGAFAAARALRTRWFTVEVAGDSMEPALEAGDWLVMVRRPPPPGAEAFGHIVVTRDLSGRLLVKRVVGLPGETVQFIDGHVRVDGKTLEEAYVRGETLPPHYRALAILDDDSYYLLGDHRPASTDSRDLGPVARSAIEGTAVLRYWPRGRIGRLAPPERHLLEG